MSWDGDRDLCDRCGNLFLPEQVCDPCRTDSEIVRAAAHVIRLRLRPGRRPRFVTSVFIGVLERYADALAANDALG